MFYCRWEAAGRPPCQYKLYESSDKSAGFLHKEVTVTLARTASGE